MSDPLKTWHEEHATFGRLLAVLESQVDLFHAGEEPSYELMLDIVDYLRHYADRHHHPREDAAFDRLARRNPDLKPQINRLRHEHRVIASAGDELLARLREITVGAVFPRSAVESAAATYLVYYRHHIATEERDLIPRASRLFGPDDWAAVDASGTSAGDPLGAGATDARFESLRREIATLTRTSAPGS